MAKKYDIYLKGTGRWSTETGIKATLKEIDLLVTQGTWMSDITVFDEEGENVTDFVNAQREAA